ncbi:SRPBCC family protein [Pedobacter frigoris]|uniref:ATPase n=1 Tax=Pedobacter frigoris TaxID=2571272 RepID=A0A4V5NZS2_9SPHI|nr:SRPBCC family protein [Pedobacter frigoris]TKC09662.1 ATPase [Pedobacter frigoris]
MSTAIPPINPDCEIVTTRTTNTSQALAFKAWADPDHLKNWWGPVGFTNTFHEFDFRPGGKWRFTMHGPEKGNYQNECEFTVIEEPSVIIWKHISQPLFDVIATFEKVSDGETKVIFRQVFATEKECNKIRPYVEDKNEENMDKLEQELAKMS